MVGVTGHAATAAPAATGNDILSGDGGLIFFMALMEMIR